MKTSKYISNYRKKFIQLQKLDDTGDAKPPPSVQLGSYYLQQSLNFGRHKKLMISKTAARKAEFQVTAII